MIHSTKFCSNIKLLNEDPILFKISYFNVFWKFLSFFKVNLRQKMIEYIKSDKNGKVYKSLEIGFINSSLII